MYKIIVRPILFLFKPETIHNIVFVVLKIARKTPGIRFIIRKMFYVTDSRLSTNLFGIDFPNKIGLAAGLDKNAEAYEMFGDMGFGFVEIGTFTPLSQPGNDLPRLFRLKKDNGLINRMGFNNLGVDYVVNKLSNDKRKVIIGGNIGKNKVTPNDKAVDDYLYCLNALHSYVDYFVVNVSSPNTPNLRELQDKAPLTEILNTLQNKNKEYPKPKPILLKIAPDLTNSQLDDIIDIVRETKIDGLVATNTTIERSNLSYSTDYINDIGSGGLSGRPLRDRSTEVISYIYKKSKGSIPIIGVGGIMNENDAFEKLEAGASLIQIYTGFIYEGPALVKRINKAILKNK